MKQSAKNISSGINPLGPSNKVKAAIRKAVRRLSEPQDEDVARLVRQFSSKTGVAPGSVVLGPSCRETGESVFSALRPERLVVLGPSDGRYVRWQRGGPQETLAIPAPVDRGLPVSAGLLDCLQLRSGDAVVVSEPNCVTGREIGKEGLREIAERVAAAGAVLVVDLSLSGFTLLESCPIGQISSGSAVVMGTTALYYGLPGLELSFALVSPSIAPEISASHAGALNLLSVVAAREAWKDAAYVRSTREYLVREHALVRKLLARSGGWEILPSDSTVFLGRRPVGHEGVEQRLGQAGFTIKRWSTQNGPELTYFRFSVMRHEENLRMAKILGTREHRG